MEFVVWIESNDRWQAHIETPHCPPFLRFRLHPWPNFRKHFVYEDRSGQYGIHSGWETKAPPPPARPD
jgi:hypothetical protein